MRFSFLLLAAWASIPRSSAQLNELAKAAGKLYFGTATDNPELSNSTYISILDDTREFGQLTPSNGMKWEFVEPSPGVFNYTPGSIVANLATKNRQILRCHNLVWYSQLAPWVTTTTWTAASLTRALVQHITHEVSHWRSQCYAWDVVNEALNDDGSYRNNTFLQILGPEYLKIAFAAAAAADPAARLYYNDYNIEYAGPKATAAREKIVGFLQDAGIRIDGVGLESHFLVGETPSLEDQVENMQSFVRMGVDVAITELDVRMLNPPDEASLAQQTKDYQAAVGACLQVPRCVGITVWDFYDPFSWIPGTFPGYGSADLYFPDFTKHPAYYGVVDVLKNDTSVGRSRD